MNIYALRQDRSILPRRLEPRRYLRLDQLL